MRTNLALAVVILVGLALASRRAPEGQARCEEPQSTRVTDAVAAAQAPAAKRLTRKPPSPPAEAQPITAALTSQPHQGKATGFDFSIDPLNSPAPRTSPETIQETDIKELQTVTELQQKLLAARYDLSPRTDPGITMSGGKPLALGPTARLARGTTWEGLGRQDPGEILAAGTFPYPSLPHPKHATGGQVFPGVQIELFPRLKRFDVDFDIPEAFLPEFPPPMFLQNRPELGDVSQGEVVSINNFRRLLAPILTPVQLEGLRLLLTPFPQEEFNPTEDRKTLEPSLGVACLDCHVNGHTTGQFHLTPDVRPQERRFRLDTVSLRGVAHQQLHGSKRSLRSVEDFTEFEFPTAYFNGDFIRAMKKGATRFERLQVAAMAQFQNMLAFPPAPKLDLHGRLIPSQTNESERRGEAIFFGKARCADCHPAPFYLDQQMHDLAVERFVKEPPTGPMKTPTLRGIRDSPPYLHDGRLLTLEDTVEFFNLIDQLGLTADEKQDLVMFLRCL